jgi:hypothetical protein
MKRTHGQGPGREELLAKSAPSTLELVDLLADLAAENELQTVDTPAGILVKTADRRSVANLYFGDYNSIDIPLQPLRERGWNAEADDILQALSRMTPKTLTTKYPALPTADAIAHWDEFQKLLEGIVALYAR